jgi:tetratricopeptide (TPR) repeat protein
MPEYFKGLPETVTRLGQNYIQAQQLGMQRKEQEFARHMQQGELLVQLGQQQKKDTPEFQQAQRAFQQWIQIGSQHFPNRFGAAMRGLSLQGRQEKEAEGFTLGPGQVRFRGGKEIARGPEKKISPTKDTRTARQKEYDRYKEVNPNYKGSIIDFRKAMTAKDPNEIFLSLASKDLRVMSGRMSLGDAAIEHKKAYQQLSITFNMQKYGKTREEVISAFEKQQKK